MKSVFFFSLALWLLIDHASAIAQDTVKDDLRVTSSHLHSDAENAEICFDFNHPVTAPAAASLHIQEDSKNFSVQNITATDTALCLYPLRYSHSYQINLAAIKGAGGEVMSAPYHTTIAVPDRAPLLAFTGLNGGVNGFGTFGSPFSLRTINVPRASIEIFRITDPAAMAQAWQDRAQTTLAPTESLYIARTKGQAVWHSVIRTQAPANSSNQAAIDLRTFLPDLPAGLYLMTASVGTAGDVTADKTEANTLTPLAATWFTKSDFTLRAVRDAGGIHVFATTPQTAKTDLRLLAIGKQQEIVAETYSDAAGMALWSATALAPESATSVIGLDAIGNVGFAAVETLPAPAPQPPLSERASSDLTPPINTHDLNAPTVTLTSDLNQISGTSAGVTVQSTDADGKAAPLIDGHVFAAWQKRDPATAGWADFVFGAAGQTSEPVSPSPQQIGDFLTDLQGSAHLRVVLPKPPSDPGLYQIALTAEADQNQTVHPLILPWRADDNVVGIKVLAPQARFLQNGLARFALIALSGGDKPRDLSGLTYQFYEEGRHFEWYQDDGKWNTKRQPRLRPMGGGNLSVKADGSTVLEWPVTSGNYRLVLRDASGQTVAQTSFSAGWVSTNAVTDAQNLSVDFPALLHTGQQETAHFYLPHPAMITAIIADGRIRQTVQEFRAKGDNSLAFTPGDDWQNRISLSLSATAAIPDQAIQAYRGTAEGHLVKDTGDAPAPKTASPNIQIFSPQQTFSLRPGFAAPLTVDIHNQGQNTENLTYSFTTAPDLNILPNSKGQITIQAGQNRRLDLTVRNQSNSTTHTTKELKLELGNGHGLQVNQIWSVAMLPPAPFLISGEATRIVPGQALLPPHAHGGGDTTVLIARHPVGSLGEILSFVFNAHPFTTAELAGGIESLRIWQETYAQSGLAPNTAIAARREEWITRLLQNQNKDGSFSNRPNGQGMMADTATALMALGPDSSPSVSGARTQAITYLRTRLANTWFDANERRDRAAAYAALAAANAIDPASLHYFSDLTAPDPLPPVAAAQLAAAFKQIHDPNAAAFWIGKMLANDRGPRTPRLIGALATTDALSSDDVHTAMHDMAISLRKGNTPDIVDACDLLQALASDLAHAGKGRLSASIKNSSPNRDFTGVLALQLSDPVLATLRNGGTEPLWVNLVTPENLPPAQAVQSATPHATITRHIYRLNGVEVKPPAKPQHGDFYMIELVGKTPPPKAGEFLLLHDSAETSLQPIGCALSAHSDTMGFLPWLTVRDLTAVGACVKRPFEIDAVLTMPTVASPTSEGRAFRMIYFARIDAPMHGNLPAPIVRFIKEKETE